MLRSLFFAKGFLLRSPSYGGRDGGRDGGRVELRRALQVAALRFTRILTC
jgi:hypothetical protein